MKILVIDDSPIHQEAARALFQDHDLTVAGSYDEGRKAIERDVPWELVTSVCEQRGITLRPYQEGQNPQEWDASRKAYDKAQQQVEAELRPEMFDAVLVDLLMPASDNAQGSKGYKYVGQEMPVGIFLALLAAKQGAKHVALLTDSNHHDHPASACLDAFWHRASWGGEEKHPDPLIINGAQVVLSNNREWIMPRMKDNLAVGWNTWSEYHKACRQDTTLESRVVPAKNWRALLDYVMNPKEGSVSEEE